MVKRVALRTIRTYSVLFIFVAICIIGFVFILRSRKQLAREAMVFVGDPTVIVSWEETKKQYVIITIPSSLVIEGVHKYGTYSLSSLWHLDQLEKRHGDLYVTSLSENFALPIYWYATHSKPIDTNKSSIVQFTLSRTSLWSLFQSIINRTSSISLVDAFYIWRSTRAIDADTSRIVDLRTISVGDLADLPDGTKQEIFNVESYDGVIGDILENLSVRQESIRIAILNTTEMGGIGGKIARMLEHFGCFVVYVGNDDLGVDGVCELRGTKERLSSNTARIISRYYHCSEIEVAEAERGDLTIRLGKGFEKRYLPY